MRLTLPPVRRVLTPALARPLVRSVVPAAAVLALGVGLLAGVPASAAPAPATSTASTTAATSAATSVAAVAAKPGRKAGKNRPKARPKPKVGLRPGSYQGRVKPGNGLPNARITFRVTKKRTLAQVRSGFLTNCDYGFGYRGREKRFAWVERVEVGRQGKFAGRDAVIDQRVRVKGRLKGRDLTWGYLKFSDTVCSRSSAFSARRVGR